MEEVKITIIGAGVIGLAIGFELSKTYKDIFILEKNLSFGQETSSRNSEVIHAGIYYPQNSLKATTCREGRSLLYEFCEKYNIAHKRIGKLIVAVNQKETKDLEKLLQNARRNGVDDLILLSAKEATAKEPQVFCQAALYSPSTGILDTHTFMKTLSSLFTSGGGAITYNTEAVGIKKQKEGFEITVSDKNEGDFSFFTQVLINCAGLNSDKVAGLAGLMRKDYQLKYCKGDYFRVSLNKAKLVNRLVYPVPKTQAAGLGIHATPDLAGSMRLGPDDEYVKKIDYTVAESKRQAFYQSVKTFFPFIELEDIQPDMAGIRPKLQGPNEGFRDFLIKDERKSGIQGLINLIGIESPGLTSSLAIAKLVSNLVKNYF